jgi:hypothetical protein
MFRSDKNRNVLARDFFCENEGRPQNKREQSNRDLINALEEIVDRADRQESLRRLGRVVRGFAA